MAQLQPTGRQRRRTGLRFAQAQRPDDAPARTARCPRGGSDGRACGDGAGQRGGDVDVGSRDDTATPGRRWLRRPRQFFAAGESPTAPTTRPVLLVHGFAGTTSSWSLVAHTLRARGLTVEAMSYPPLGTSVEQLAEQLVAEVETILVPNRCRQGASGRTQSGRCCHRRRPSPTVVSTGGLTRSSPWARRSAGRPGPVCCRFPRSSGRCDRVRRCCAGSPPRHCPTACGGCR